MNAAASSEKLSLRKSYGKIADVLEVPNLVQIQLDSFRWLLDEGIKELFNEVSPIQGFAGSKYELRFVGYQFKDEKYPDGHPRLEYVAHLDRWVMPKYSEEECRERDMTYSVPLYVEVELEKKTGEGAGERIRQWLFMGDIPLMTRRGTFVINGAERVVVSQLVRSPGVYFTIEEDIGTGKGLCFSKLIPNRGAWLEFETSNRDVISVKVDRKRKVSVVTLLRAMGFSKDDQLLEMFADVDTNADHQYIKTTIEREPSVKTEKEALVDFYKKLRPGEPSNPENARNLLFALFFNPRRYDLGRVGRYKLNSRLRHGAPTEADTRKLSQEEAKTKFEGVKKAFGKFSKVSEPGIKEQLDLINKTRDVMGWSKSLAYFIPRELQEEVDGIRKSFETYDSSEAEAKAVQFCFDVFNALSPRVLTSEDLISIVRNIVTVNNSKDHPDDIDHLGNRRIRAVGELIQNQLRIGLLRMERVVKERMTLVDPEQATPGALINVRPVVAAIKEFFGGSQLSQFMDQTNPLAELTHKRRLSALGPGGLSRERAGFDVRDVHHSHYGRICPIETPEGPNIGLLGSLATYGKVNEYGFIETPYRRVMKEVPNRYEEVVGRTVRETITTSSGDTVIKAGDVINNDKAKKITQLKIQTVKVKPFVSNEIVYMSADKEEQHNIAQASARVDSLNQFVDEKVEIRRGADFLMDDPLNLAFMDVSPKQIVSVSTALVPFLEHDDANRALMGSNMQRQAVPLLRSEAPVVGTGMEGRVAQDSGQMVLAEAEGVVTSVTGREIKVRDTHNNERTYKLLKFTRSNQGTCNTQRAIVNVGDVVRKNQPLADSSSTDHGELALGQNVLAAFMSWEGYNFEDAVIISEALVKKDFFTSIHIEKHEVEARSTKLGDEEITRDIPNVGEENLHDLDESGIVRIGAEVGPGDILVGKITPKGETELTAEEKLLRAIFGEKAREVKDTSLRVPHGERGKVIDVKVFLENKDELPPGVKKLVRVWVAQTRKVSEGDKMAGRHGNKGVIAKILPMEDMPFLPDGTPVDIVLNPLGVPSRMNLGQVLETHLGLAASMLGFAALTPVFDGAQDTAIEDELGRAWIAQKAGAIPPLGFDGNTVVDMAKVKAWLEPRGYKAERIFNDKHLGEAKRVCTRIWLQEEAGVNVDDLKNDDQLFAKARTLYKEKKMAPPVFGKTVLYDGRTGGRFDDPVTVGHVYMMKLIHMVEDKVHARSTGPYSLITQQPLGGKAQFGGQRFGEMEVWALEAYSVAHNLQEILTVKSDDVVGRVKTYEAIVKGEDVSQPGVPESFHVLLKELQSLGLAVELLNEEEEKVTLPEETAPETSELEKGLEEISPGRI